MRFFRGVFCFVFVCQGRPGEVSLKIDSDVRKDVDMEIWLQSNKPWVLGTLHIKM